MGEAGVPDALATPTCASAPAVAGVVLSLGRTLELHTGIQVSF